MGSKGLQNFRCFTSSNAKESVANAATLLKASGCVGCGVSNVLRRGPKMSLGSEGTSWIVHVMLQKTFEGIFLNLVLLECFAALPPTVSYWPSLRLVMSQCKGVLRSGSPRHLCRRVAL